MKTLFGNGTDPNRFAYNLVGTQKKKQVNRDGIEGGFYSINANSNELAYR